MPSLHTKNCLTGCATLHSTRSNVDASSTSSQLPSPAFGTFRVLECRRNRLYLPRIPRRLPPHRRRLDPLARGRPPLPPNTSNTPSHALSVSPRSSPELLGTLYSK